MLDRRAQVVDVNVLNEIARRDQKSPDFEIWHWRVEPLGAMTLANTTVGTYVVSGSGGDHEGLRSWKVVLKQIHNSSAAVANPRSWGYGKRELLAFQSGLLADLPVGLRAPRCYAACANDDNSWIWMEHIEEWTRRRWSMADYYRAARLMGRFGGAYLGGLPLPQKPWLCDFHTAFAEDGWWATYIDPASPYNAWQNPLVDHAFRSVRAGILNIWDEHRTFCAMLDRLPQILCHHDLHRRNLMLCRDEAGDEELVAVDWAFCGPGAVGLDMAALVATSAFLFEIEPGAVAEFEAVALDGYVAGLRDAGWSDDAQLAHLGYLLAAALWTGIRLPGWAAIMLSEDSDIDAAAVFGRTQEEVLTGWVTLAEFLLDRADRACALVHKLNL